MAKVVDSELVGVFAVRMREERLRLGISQEELAHRANLDRTYVSGCERRLRNPSLVSVERIANALGIPAGDLLNSSE
ncbi:XRE family transcriptional regulator [Loktanella sp. IMCC34160]|uniref:helix-turn-helix domain-containing protein n=1 Tax=Loktanella sp. IMCC34160 TaxID=2510646 RepID=UPI00101D8026|nr:helix-turn-helix transcriptional regulator [Loktanella sp. IMCC34160]RYG89775.1 XRE family transcriptional regulator [Loktanella sp. IMCC34160]